MKLPYRQRSITTPIVLGLLMFVLGGCAGNSEQVSEKTQREDKKLEHAANKKSSTPKDPNPPGATLKPPYTVPADPPVPPEEPPKSPSTVPLEDEQEKIRQAQKELDKDETSKHFVARQSKGRQNYRAKAAVAMKEAAKAKEDLEKKQELEREEIKSLGLELAKDLLEAGAPRGEIMEITGLTEEELDQLEASEASAITIGSGEAAKTEITESKEEDLDGLAVNAATESDEEAAKFDASVSQEIKADRERTKEPKN